MELDHSGVRVIINCYIPQERCRLGFHWVLGFNNSSPRRKKPKNVVQDTAHSSTSGWSDRDRYCLILLRMSTVMGA